MSLSLPERSNERNDSNSSKGALLNATVWVAVAAVSAFMLSSVWYTAVTPVERRVLGQAVARQSPLDGVGSAVLLGLVLWLGFPLVLLSGSIIWDQVLPVTALLHAGDWLLKVLVISAIVGLWL